MRMIRGDPPNGSIKSETTSESEATLTVRCQLTYWPQRLNGNGNDCDDDDDDTARNSRRFTPRHTPLPMLQTTID